MPATKSIALFFQEGSSDKVYNAQIVKDGDGFSVFVQWGRRSAKLSEGRKAVQVPLEKAEKVFDKLVRDKTSKGYAAITQDVKPAPEAPPQGEGSGTKAKGVGRERLEQTAQLLNFVEPEVAERLLADDGVVAQQKFDGMRLLVHVGERIVGTNRNGEVVKLDASVQAAVAAFEGSAVLDGEFLDRDPKIYWLFDLLELDGKSIRNECYADRLKKLEAACTGKDGVLRVVPTARSEAEKRAMFGALNKASAEGIVFKKADAPYMPGRPASGGAQLKLKFVKSADVVITENAGNAYLMAVYDGDQQQLVGKCFAGTTNESRAEIDRLLAEKKRPIAEVRYLYATDSLNLYQPVFVRLRTDKTEKQCLIDQLVQTDRDAFVAIES